VQDGTDRRGDLSESALPASAELSRRAIE